ncbi:MAG: hypothetical protein WCE38_03880, partial [Burkholderiales bacterium]
VDRGEALLRRAMAVAPRNAAVAANLGWALAESGRYEVGIGYLTDALAAKPDDPELRIMRSLIDVKHGNYARGWRDYRARFESKLYVGRPFKFRQWDSESLAGKRVLVYGEQGLGDEIMFASCLPDLFEEAAACYLDCDPRLARLFERSFAATSVFGTTQRDPAPVWVDSIGSVDFQLPIGDLACKYRTTPEAFPQRPRYLCAGARRVAQYRERLNALGPGIKVGLSWRGGTSSTRGSLRSIGLAPLAAGLRDVPAHWISLQYGQSDAEIAAARVSGFVVHHWEEAIADYDETAALVEALDVVVSVCTSVVHLAGALGRPTLVIVPAIADWRFGEKGEGLPWHPTVRLLRQRRPREWGDVLARLRDALISQGSDGTADGESD